MTWVEVVAGAAWTEVSSVVVWVVVGRSGVEQPVKVARAMTARVKTMEILLEELGRVRPWAS